MQEVIGSTPIFSTKTNKDTESKLSCLLSPSLSANTLTRLPIERTLFTNINEPSTTDEPAKLADIYTQIIADFTAAATNLPNTITSANPFSASGTGKTATSATAQAMLAKAYLTRGYTKAGTTADFQRAADLTKTLLMHSSQQTIM